MRLCSCTFSKSLSNDCQLLQYTHNRFDKVWETTESMRSICEIEIILSGYGEYVQSGNTVPIKQGDIIIMNAYTPRYERSSSTNPIEHAFFSINNFGFEKAIPYTDKQSLLKILDKPTENILHYDLSEDLPFFIDLIELFDKEIDQTPPFWEQNLQYHFQLALVLILRKTLLQQSSPQIPITANKSERIPFAVAHYLDNYFTFEHTLDELSQRFFISKNYLLSSFKKTFGITPMQYLNKTRIREAQRTLQNTNFSIGEVATQTGFVNASHFARVYKQYTGITPSQEVKNTHKFP